MDSRLETFQLIFVQKYQQEFNALPESKKPRWFVENVDEIMNDFQKEANRLYDYDNLPNGEFKTEIRELLTEVMDEISAHTFS